jgi:hypothetical protein
MADMKEFYERQFDLHLQYGEPHDHESLNALVMSFRDKGLTGERQARLERMEWHLVHLDNIAFDRATNQLSMATEPVPHLERKLAQIRGT